MLRVDEIAKDLAVSRNTVKTHVRAIYHKLGANERRDAVYRARRAGLLTAFEQADAARGDLHAMIDLPIATIAPMPLSGSS